MGSQSCTGSVVLTQTHPAAPYVCRTGNITLRCQYDGVENVLKFVLWNIAGQITANVNPSTIPGHTALPRTTTYQEVVVDNYTNLATGYRCLLDLSNGSKPPSNTYSPQSECLCYFRVNKLRCRPKISYTNSVFRVQFAIPACAVCILE